MDKTVIDSYPRYDSYKDSGVDWLGNIPEEWSLTPAFKFVNENKLKNKGLTVDTVLSLSYGNILIKPKEKLTGLVPESFETYQIVEPNDIIIRCMDLQNDKTSLRIGLVKDKGIITSAYLGLKVGSSYLPEYLYYYLHSLDTSKAIYKMGTGLRQNLSFSDFKRFQVPNISLEVQRSIVSFVKTKTAQIDQAVTLKQQQITKLEEYKQIVIQNAVTKGLNPDAPMKDSGVDWIGDIPEHWKTDVGLNIFSEKKQANKGMVESTVLSLSYGRIIIKPAEKMYGLMPESFETYQVVMPNDIIIRGTDLQNDKNSLRTSISKVKGIITSAYLNLAVINNNYADFYHLYLHTLDTTKAIYKYGSGLRQNLSYRDFRRMAIVVAPLKEQIEIVEYTNDLSKQITATINTYEKQIDRLKEYKTILINQAVTGKIKVS
ncbi:restriction endonuclease subunit S [Psychrobacter immobilis]|uniref:restriction endonuclease subunit S n=1 Tax=Psychrobacter immobilis TaxID=498 RepID=UPI00191B1AE5|nr:restriction endonuclease subunit S [Psychrobacter immobilis]